MFDFNSLVYSILLEGVQEFKQQFQGKIDVPDQALNRIYTLLGASDRYIPGEQWEPYLEFTPILNAVIRAGGGSYNSVRALIAGDSRNNIPRAANMEEFYDRITPKLTPEILNEVKPIDRGYDFNILVPDVRRTYDKALKQRSTSTLSQNVWPSISQETIVNGLVKILQTRLTGLERAKLSFNFLASYTASIGKGTSTTLSRPSFDNLMQIFIKDIFTNTTAYSSGSKKANPAVVDILQLINITYEDLLELSTYTKQFYESLLYIKFPNAENIPTYKRAIESSLEESQGNTYILAQTGQFVFTPPLTRISQRTPQDRSEQLAAAQNQSQSRTIYNLANIEKTDNDSAKQIVRIMKQISTGVREKDPQFQKILSQKMQALTNAAQAIWDFSGQSLYPS